MAYTLTIADLRQDLGDTGTPPAFADPELQALLDREGGDHRRALLRGLWQLLTQAARFNDYSLGQSREQQSQVFDHLKALYAAVREEVAGSGPQVAILGLVAGEPSRLPPADLSRLSCPY